MNIANISFVDMYRQLQIRNNGWTALRVLLWWCLVCELVAAITESFMNVCWVSMRHVLIQNMTQLSAILILSFSCMSVFAYSDIFQLSFLLLKYVKYRYSCSMRITKKEKMWCTRLDQRYNDVRLDYVNLCFWIFYYTCDQYTQTKWLHVNFVWKEF